MKTELQISWNVATWIEKDLFFNLKFIMAGGIVLGFNEAKTERDSISYVTLGK